MTLVGSSMLGMAELLGVAGLINYQTLLGTQGRPGFIVPAMCAMPSLDIGMRHTIRLEGHLFEVDRARAPCLPANPPQEFDIRYDQHGFRNDEDLDPAAKSWSSATRMLNPRCCPTRVSDLDDETVVRIRCCEPGISGYGPEQVIDCAEAVWVEPAAQGDRVDVLLRGTICCSWIRKARK